MTLSTNSGAFVSSIEMSSIREFFEALEISQQVATLGAADRRTDEDLVRINKKRVAFEMAAAAADIRGKIDANFKFDRPPINRTD